MTTCYGIPGGSDGSNAPWNQEDAPEPTKEDYNAAIAELPECLRDFTFSVPVCELADALDLIGALDDFPCEWFDGYAHEDVPVQAMHALGDYTHIVEDCMDTWAIDRSWEIAEARS